ncbi:hypothetical protein TVAG_049450 [Trichomonas vaginalis G3]|uniref:Uncharacterized protein n=1 Tax=Trichomonas vaginalis (strain ATCC PRA-98 / G3) TaxID=412133 RepID=A2G1D4_TRIV3|nr:hypothetical protein TVAGG3_0134750 [Trichomonas vaginalis G3]EAX89034.1 hypothetical protein TVAG_049450 [Trichomonas vaginalis G3]KAI5546318.1 hypothetical protein TVAGG3_0134750 [Trichomonas vaginalis G3]|eukprot:XP_001301964.1 hypothetical protein [Trichomonas vaginalis G3]
MISFLTFLAYRDTRPKRNPVWGDELMFGNWTITSTELTSNSTGSSYNINLKPHPKEDALIGDLKITSHSEEPFEYHLILRFNGTDRDTFHVFYQEDDSEIHVTDVKLDFEQNNLLNAFGQILGTNITFSLNMLTYLCLNLIFYDNNSNEITVYSMKKPDPMPPGKDFKASIFTIATIAYLFFRNKNQTQNQQQENQEEQPTENNNGEENKLQKEQPKQGKKGKGKKH